MTPLRGMAAALAVAGLLLAGCSETEAGDPSPSPGANGGEPTSTTTDQELAPKVPDPIKNAARYREDACAMLSKADAKALNAVKAEQNTEPTGTTSCSWKARNGSSFGMSMQSENGTTLELAYQAHEQDPGQFGYFDPQAFAGHPGIFGSQTPDERNEGRCVGMVAVTDSQLVTFIAQLTRASASYDKPCEVARMGVEMALTTMKKADR